MFFLMFNGATDSDGVGSQSMYAGSGGGRFGFPINNQYLPCAILRLF